MAATTRPNAEITDAELRGLPKAELHVHLEGCLSDDLVEGWARAAGVAPPQWDGRGGLPRFLDHLDACCALARSAETLAAATYAVAVAAGSDGVLATDLIVNPTHWAAWAGDLPAFLSALGRGIDDAVADGLPPVGLCISLHRSQDAASAVDLVDRLTELRDPHVVALSVDGDERAAGRTGARFADAFARAAAAGLRRSVHAGESSGPEGVRDAVDLLGADRIEHGIRAVEDPSVVELLAQRAIPLGVCPTSNVRLGVVTSIASHPIERLRTAGVRVTVNTDDPVLLGTDLLAEYRTCIDTFGWEAPTVADVARTSVECSFTLACAT